jgi:hypothetical protein
MPKDESFPRDWPKQVERQTAQRRIGQQMTAECHKAQDSSLPRSVTKGHAAHKQHPKKNIVAEGVMPPSVRLSAEQIRDRIEIRQDRSDNAPVSQSSISAPDIADRPTEGCVWFQVHQRNASRRIRGLKANVDCLHARMERAEGDANGRQLEIPSHNDETCGAGIRTLRVATQEIGGPE